MYHSIPMLGNRTNEQWIAQYASSHQHPVNRLCHTLGIPTILLSVLVSQFIGHAFEGKPPEFFSDWRFLFVGVRWWWAKIRGKV